MKVIGLTSTPRRVAVVLVAAVLASSCGGGESTPQERPLSLAEASMLSQSLYSNLLKGGAEFEAATTLVAGGPQLSMSGIVDWSTHSGHATVATTSADQQVSEVWWEKNAVGERRPGLDSILAASGAGREPVLLRAPDKGRRLDQVIAVVVALATTQPENAQLLLQTPGTAFLRTDFLRGMEVVVMRYGTQSLYWLEAGSGALLRFESTSGTTGIPLVVDIVRTGPFGVEFPAAERQMTYETIGELVQMLTPV
jgi:hypothetical protein